MAAVKVGMVIRRKRMDSRIVVGMVVDMVVDMVVVVVGNNRHRLHLNHRLNHHLNRHHTSRHHQNHRVLHTSLSHTLFELPCIQVDTHYMNYVRPLFKFYRIYFDFFLKIF
jgi:hypothetical protein